MLFRSDLVCYIYEYLTTLDREVELFWKGEFSGASILFFLNRYPALATYLYDLTIFLPMSDWVSNSNISYPLIHSPDPEN